MPLHHIGRYIAPDEYNPVWDPTGSERGIRTGGWRHCQMEGCNGLRVGLRWANGRISWPCTKGLITRPDGQWQMK
jgi:hypothetical protein